MTPESAAGSLRAGDPDVDRKRDWLIAAGLGAFMLALWMVRHPYKGIWHDAQLYSFQAMARLKPELLGNDAYLRFGSQDRYSIFSSLHAVMIAWLGWEPATALLTFVSHAAFLAAAWFLARTLMSRRLAWLAVGLLLAVSGKYGAYDVWDFLEGFLTPRLPTEALVLAGLAAMLAQRRWLACFFFAVGTLLHPLMAAVGVAVALYIRFVPPRPSARLIASWLAVAAAALAMVVVLPMMASLRFDTEWLDVITEGQPFLFVLKWRMEDWARCGVQITTLVVGAVMLPPGSPQRRLCVATLAVALAGLIVSLVGGDVLHIVLIVQTQPWRCLWLAAVIAVLLIPLIASRGWQLGPLGQLAVALVIIAWLSIDEPYTLASAPLAIAAAAAAGWRKQLPPRIQRLLLVAGWFVLALVLIRGVANTILFAGATPDVSPVPELERQIRAFSRDGLLAILALLVAWWLLTSRKLRATRIGVTVTATIGCLALLPAAASEWRKIEYPQRTYDAFASWRSLIPPGEEVLWVEGSVETWALLERPRYLTSHQMASMLFARGAAMEMKRRVMQLAPFASDQTYIFRTAAIRMGKASMRPSLAAMCNAIDARFIVSAFDLGASPLAAAPTAAYRRFNLYRCER